MGFCISAILAGRADAALTTSHLPSEAAAVAAAQANGGIIRFTGEARVGHGNDWNLGMRRLPDEAPTATARFNGWPNGSPISFTLSSDGHQTVSLTLTHAGNHSMVTYTADGLADLTDLFVSARAVNSSTSTTLAGLTLNGLPVGDAPAAASTGPEAQDVLRIQGGALADGFTLSGTITLRWRGAKPQGSDIRALFWGARSSDTQPPVIVFTSPSTEEGFVNSASLLVAGTVSDASPVTSVQVNGIQVPLVNGTFQSTVTLVDGVNEILIDAQDAAGNQGIASRFVTLDTTPPELQVKTPSAGQIVNASEIQVTGQATDDRELAEVTVQENAVPVAADLFAATVPVASGDNLISVRAVDRAGNDTIVNVPVNRFDLPDVTITSPADLSFLKTTTVDVSGTVSDPQARVTVNGISATVSGTTFTAPGVPLIEGGNILTATATDVHGHVATGSINVVRDLTPPHLAVQYPPDGSTVLDSTVTVTGLVNDIVAGTVNAAQATVTVNGRPATVANRSFVAAGVPLAPGDNVLAVVATDAGGNTGEARTTVRFEAPSGPRISILSGNLQENGIGTALPQPLVVTLLDAAGQPVPGRTVLFKVRGNDGSLDGGRRQIAVATDASGQAAAHFTLGLRAGAANQAVEASAAGFQGPAVFLATARPGPATYIVVDSGDQQVGIAGRLLPRPLVAVVTDRGYNRLEGTAVRFNVTQGRGHFENGLQEALTFSDSDGRLILPLALDPEEGIANNVVEAKIDGLDASPVAGFAASGRAAGDPAATSISGVVLDNASQPLAGVTLRVLDTALTARTDANGALPDLERPGRHRQADRGRQHRRPPRHLAGPRIRADHHPREG